MILRFDTLATLLAVALLVLLGAGLLDPDPIARVLEAVPPLAVIPAPRR